MSPLRKTCRAPLELHRAGHKGLELRAAARCNMSRKVFTTNINEVVTYKFFTSMIPRKAFLGIPFIWFSLRSLNKRTEKKKYIVLTKRTHFSNLHELMEPPRAWKSRYCWICYTTRCFQFCFSPLEVCGMS